MTKTTRIIRTVYLYLAAFVSLIFVAVGTGNLLNIGLKTYVFPKAEKGGYGRCNEQPPIYGLTDIKNSQIATADQKVQLEQMLRDYENWKKNNTGEECYAAERQNNAVNFFTMIIIALPICLLHWRIIKKEKQEKEEQTV